MPSKPAANQNAADAPAASTRQTGNAQATQPAKAGQTAQSHAAAQAAPVQARVLDRPWMIGIFLAVVGLLVAADLVIKSLAFEKVAGRPVVLDPQRPLEPDIPYHQPRVVVPGVLNLWLTTNTGAVFGSAKGAKPLFVTVSFIAIIVVMYLFVRSAANLYMFHLGLAMVLGGALGNLYDRLMFSAVRDMFHLFPNAHLPFGLTWPGGNPGLYPWIFNFADVALVVGVILLGILSWHYDRQRQTASQAQG